MKRNTHTPQQLFDEATVLRDNGDEDGAIKLYTKAHEILEKEKDYKKSAEALQMIGVCYRLKGDEKNALSNLETAAYLFEEMGDILGIGNSYRDIGLFYLDKHDIGNAMKWLAKSDGIFKPTNYLIPLGITDIKLGTAYMRGGQLQQGRKYISSGIQNIRKAGGSWFHEMLGFLHLAESELQREKYNEALTFALAGTALVFVNHGENEQKRKLVELFGYTAWGYCKTGNLPDANRYLKRAFDLLSAFPQEIQKPLLETIKYEELEKLLEQD